MLENIPMWKCSKLTISAKSHVIINAIIILLFLSFCFFFSNQYFYSCFYCQGATTVAIILIFVFLNFSFFQISFIFLLWRCDPSGDLTLVQPTESYLSLMRQTGENHHHRHHHCHFCHHHHPSRYHHHLIELLDARLNHHKLLLSETNLAHKKTNTLKKQAH